MFLKNTEYGSISFGKNKILSEAGNWLFWTLKWVFHFLHQVGEGSDNVTTCSQIEHEPLWVDQCSFWWLRQGVTCFCVHLMAVIWGTAGKGSCHIDYICNRTTNLPLFSSLWTDLGWLTYYPKQGSHQFYYSPPKTYYLELKYLLVTDPTSHPKLVLN